MYERAAGPRHSGILHHVSRMTLRRSITANKTKTVHAEHYPATLFVRTPTRGQTTGNTQSRVEGRFVLEEFVLQQELVLDDNARAHDEASECAGHSLNDVPESCKRRNGVGRR